MQSGTMSKDLVSNTGPPPSVPPQAPQYPQNDDVVSIQEPIYPVNFEQQEEMRCGMHALNNALGHLERPHWPLFLPEQMESACDQFILESRIPDDNGIISDLQEKQDHMKDNGWYSNDVMSMALRRTMEYELLLGHQLRYNPNILQDEKMQGAITNQDEVHWVALKLIQGKIWLLDSRYQPKILNDAAYLSFINQYPHTYAIRDIR